MYGLHQAGLPFQELLEKRLGKHGYFQSKLVPGLWKQQWRPIQFTLVVNNFGIKYVGEEHARHLMSALNNNYTTTHNWKGSKYVGITLDWGYDGQKLYLSMPGYIGKAVIRFGHKIPTKRQDSLYPITSVNYSGKTKYAKAPYDTPFLNDKVKNYIQHVNGTPL